MKFAKAIRKSRTDWGRLEAMSDADIDTADAPKLGPDFFRRARVRVPPGKQAVSLRIDRDVLAWFKRQGPGYQTRINTVLREYTVRRSR